MFTFSGENYITVDITKVILSDKTRQPHIAGVHRMRNIDTQAIMTYNPENTELKVKKNKENLSS